MPEPAPQPTPTLAGPVDVAALTAALREALGDSLPPGRRITGDERIRIGKILADTYDAGLSIPHLVQATGRSNGFVHEVLSLGGARIRGSGARPGHSPRRRGRKPADGSR